jgi:hypothetical protein
MSHRPQHAPGFRWITKANADGNYSISPQIPKPGNTARNDGGMQLDKRQSWVAVPRTTEVCHLWRFRIEEDESALRYWQDDHEKDEIAFLRGLGKDAFMDKNDTFSNIKGRKQPSGRFSHI